MTNPIFPLSYPRFRSTLATGLPNAGGFVYTYDPGSSDPLVGKTTYSDHLLTVPNANPIVLDVTGEADIWLDGLTKIKVTDADGVLIWTRDYIGLDLVAFIASYLGGLALISKVQDASYIYGASSAGSDSYSINLNPAITVLTDGMMVVMRPDVNNTGPCTLTVNGLGPYAIKKKTKGNLVDPVDNDLVAGWVSVLVWNSTVSNWIIRDTQATLEINRKEMVVDPVSGNYNMVLADKSLELSGNGTYSVNLLPVSVAGAGFTVFIKNYGTGVITITADGTDKIFSPGGAVAGDNSIILQGCMLFQCNGTDWHVLTAIPNHGKEVFTGNGSFTVPAGVQTIWITAAAGGGGGGDDGFMNMGGGAGECVSADEHTVIPGTVYTVTVGQGGSGNVGAVAPDPGSTTSVGALVSLTGGSEGDPAGGGGVGGGPGGGPGTKGLLAYDGVTILPGLPGASIFGPNSYGSGGAGLVGSGNADDGKDGVVIIEW